MSSRPTLLYFVSEDWFFASHFVPMARCAVDLGLDVVVATRVRDHGGHLQNKDIRVIPLDLRRNSFDPLTILRQVIQLAKVLKAEQPTAVHCISLWAVLIGGVAARVVGVPALCSVTGLGRLRVGNSLASALLRTSVKRCLRFIARGRATFIFENHDDPVELGLDSRNAGHVFVPGPGVDPEDFPIVGEPKAGPVRFAVVSRMIWPKGVAIAVQATQVLRSEGLDVELSLYGSPDPANPLAIPSSTLVEWARDPGIDWQPATRNVAQIWAKTHVAVLPTSYGEGMPRSLLEAMASARPVVTTDSPGCRELVRDGVDGFVVPEGDVAAVARALRELVLDSALRAAMGNAAAKRVRDDFSAAAVSKAISDTYRSLIWVPGGSAG